MIDSIRFSPRPFRTLAVLLAVALLFGQLAACGAVIGAGAVAGIAAYDERGIDGVARDTQLGLQVREKWFQREHTMPARLGLAVYEGRALITGIVPDAVERAEAVGLAWQVEGIKDVINEMQEGGGGAEAFTRDSWISTQLKSRLTFDKEVYAVNYAIETVNGVVYLIGIAQSQAELDRVVAHARDLAYVQRVVSHVRVKGAA